MIPPPKDVCVCVCVCVCVSSHELPPSFFFFFFWFLNAMFYDAHCIGVRVPMHVLIALRHTRVPLACSEQCLC
jgi:hypothetical protein